MTFLPSRLSREPAPAACEPSLPGISGQASPQKRLRVLRCATQAFLDRGFSGANVEEIAIAAGVGKAAIYQLFGDKTELFAQCMIAATSADSALVRKSLTLDRPVEDVLTDFAEQHIMRMFRPVCGSRPYYDFARVLLSASITHPELSRRCLEVLRKEEGTPLTDYFSAAIRAGLIADADPGFLMEHFVQAIFFTNRVILEPSYIQEYRDVRGYARKTVRLFMYGCAPMARGSG